MAYNNDKEVVFSFMRRVDYNQTWEEIEYGLGYDFGDYYFGKGDSKELRQKIKDSIKFMKIQFDKVFNDNNNTYALGELIQIDIQEKNAKKKKQA